LRAEQAKALARLGLAEQALVHAAEATALLVSAGGNAAAEHALAIAQAAAGDNDSADHSFRHATDSYEERRQWRQAAAVAHDWGSALRQARRLEQAIDVFSRAALLTPRVHLFDLPYKSIRLVRWLISL
jgi:hypothetical protein